MEAYVVAYDKCQALFENMHMILSKSHPGWELYQKV